MKQSIEKVANHLFFGSSCYPSSFTFLANEHDLSITTFYSPGFRFYVRAVGSTILQQWLSVLPVCMRWLAVIIYPPHLVSNFFEANPIAAIWYGNTDKIVLHLRAYVYQVGRNVATKLLRFVPWVCMGREEVTWSLEVCPARRTVFWA